MTWYPRSYLRSFSLRVHSYMHIIFHNLLLEPNLSFEFLAWVHSFSRIGSCLIRLIGWDESIYTSPTLLHPSKTQNTKGAEKATKLTSMESSLQDSSFGLAQFLTRGGKYLIISFASYTLPKHKTPTNKTEKEPLLTRIKRALLDNRSSD